MPYQYTIVALHTFLQLEAFYIIGLKNNCNNIYLITWHMLQLIALVKLKYERLLGRKDKFICICVVITHH